MTHFISYSCITDIGKCRSENQDNYVNGSFYMDEPLKSSSQKGSVKIDTPYLLAVFDGMGGEERGEVASHLSTKCASGMYANLAKHPLKTRLSFDGDKFLRSICARANTIVCDYAKENNVRSMGTTAAMLLFERKCIRLCNLGDSRIFRIADDEITQLSQDHVSVSIQGRKPPLTQCIGIPEDELILQPYLVQMDYRKGDKYLICSDGITDMLPEDRICEIISQNNPEEATGLLLEAALDAGGVDNTTAIVIEITDKKRSE